ncbi:ribonuclease R [Seminibacterium arietis]|uniref:Ribonuclease R n=1 Tax=Seminibacterium arietis TaxID=1173502 RepID=A0ABW3IA88_9PAST
MSRKSVSQKILKKSIALCDPNYEQELKKYGNPIPSREFILKIIDQYNSPMPRENILKYFNIKYKEQQEAMFRRLRAMENDGQLIFTKRHCYALPEKLDLLKGTVIGHHDGYGFLRVVGIKEDYFIPNNQMRNIVHGDFVLAQPSGIDRKGRAEVRIVRLLESRVKPIVGRFFLENGIGFVVPDDSRITRDILIPDEYRNNARMGQVVIAELKARELRNSQLIGSISEVLGENMAKGMETEIVIRHHDIPYEFPNAVKKQVKNLTEEVSQEAKRNRVDLRNLPLVTIDSEDARDFDDAVFCQPERNGGWRLWVAIADVSYYVRPHSALDKEAYLRGNSVYFPSRVVPMLPEVLSNGLCSLNPQVDRLAMVCELCISSKGNMESYQFYEAVINSHARLTYNKVAKILDGDIELRSRYQKLVPHLQALYALYQSLVNARHQRGAIEFETIEPKFIFNEMGRIDYIEPIARNEAHKIIEECMILANVAAADFVQKNSEPALYRIHSAPSEEKLIALYSFLGECGLSFKRGRKVTTIDYAKLLEKTKDHPSRDLIQNMLLRSLSQAIYDTDNIGHFGLALEEYAHFTSPIRRYPDLTLHRGIKYLLAKQAGSKRKTTDTGGYHYKFDEMDLIGQHCSMTERRADEATREVVTWLKCEYMQDHVGETFNGVVSSVTGFGLFVKLDELFIDGLVHISTLLNDYYQFDSTHHQLIGENSGTVYRIGDRVKVSVIAVNLQQKQIDFTLLDTERKPRRLGKTKKDKLKKFKELPPSKDKKVKENKNKKTEKSAVKKIKISRKQKKVKEI